MPKHKDDPDLLQNETAPAATGDRIPVEDARRTLREHYRAFMPRALDWHRNEVKAKKSKFKKAKKSKGKNPKIIPTPRTGLDDPDALFEPPPHSGVRATTGLGKSESFWKVAATDYMPAALAEGLPARVLCFGGTHKLNEEARTRMPAGVTAALWQGPRSTKVGTNEPMCDYPKKIEAAAEFGLDMETYACCQRDDDDNIVSVCPRYPTQANGWTGCHFHMQKPAAAKAQMVLLPHECQFGLPKAIGKGFGIAFSDEAFWQDGIRNDTCLDLGSFTRELTEWPVRDKDGVASKELTDTLRALLEAIEGALEKLDDGYVPRTVLQQALAPLEDRKELVLAADLCKLARSLEWTRKHKVEFGLHPDLDEEAVERIKAKFGFLALLPGRARMWGAIESLLRGKDECSGHLAIRTDPTKKTGTRKQLCVRGHLELDARVAKLPLIHADATMTLPLVQIFLPRLKLDLDLKVAAPFKHVVQVIGVHVGKTGLSDRPPGVKPRDAKEQADLEARLVALVDMVRLMSQGKRTLVITHKAIEARFAGLAGVEVAHYGEIEGRDQWKNVEVKVTIGCPRPAPWQVERVASALTGKPVTVQKKDWVQQDRVITLSSGAKHTIKARVFPDTMPEAEMIRGGITEPAVEQADGRSRAINRTAGNSVIHYVVVPDAVIPGMQIDEIAMFSEFERDAVDEMFARGLAPEFGVDAHALYGDLFPTASAARKAIHRHKYKVERAADRERYNSQVVTRAYRISLIGRSHNLNGTRYLKQVKYQLKGYDRLTRHAWVDHDKVPDPRSVLEAKLKQPLTMFEWITDPQEAPTPALITGLRRPEIEIFTPTEPAMTAYPVPEHSSEYYDPMRATDDPDRQYFVPVSIIGLAPRYMLPEIDVALDRSLLRYSTSSPSPDWSLRRLGLFWLDAMISGLDIDEREDRIRAALMARGVAPAQIEIELHNLFCATMAKPAPIPSPQRVVASVLD